MDADELVDLLRRRHEVLAELVDGPRTAADLEARLAAPPETVEAAVEELAAAGAVLSGDDVAVTMFGRLAYERYEALTAVSRLDDALSDLPDEAIPATVFARGDVAVSTADNPLGPDDDLLDDARELRGFTPVVSDRRLRRIVERVDDGDLELDLTVTGDLFERLVTDHVEGITVLGAAADATVRRTAAALPFGCYVVVTDVGRRAVVELPGDGDVAGVVSADDEETVAWAERRIDAVVGEATAEL